MSILTFRNHQQWLEQTFKPYSHQQQTEYINTETTLPYLGVRLTLPTPSASHRDNIWTDLKQPLIGLTNILTGLFQTLTLATNILWSLLTLPLQKITNGFSYKYNLEIIKNNCKHFLNSLEIITNGMLQLLLSPVMLIRIPARVLVSKMSLCHNAQQNNDELLFKAYNLKTLKPHI